MLCSVVSVVGVVSIRTIILDLHTHPILLLSIPFIGITSLRQVLSDQKQWHDLVFQEAQVHSARKLRIQNIAHTATGSALKP